MSRAIALAALLAVAACAESEDASLVPINESEGFNVIDPVKAQIEPAQQVSLGQWSEGLEAEQPALMFGPAGTPPLFSMRCDDRRGLFLYRHGVVATGATEMMTITLGAASRQLATNPLDGPPPMLRAAVPASDALLGQFGAAAAPIVVALGDGPALTLPPSPLIGEFIRDCASARPAAAAPEADSAATPAVNSAAPAAPAPPPAR